MTSPVPHIPLARLSERVSPKPQRKSLVSQHLAARPMDPVDPQVILQDIPDIQQWRVVPGLVPGVGTRRYLDMRLEDPHALRRVLVQVVPRLRCRILSVVVQGFHGDGTGCREEAFSRSCSCATAAVIDGRGDGVMLFEQVHSLSIQAATYWHGVKRLAEGTLSAGEMHVFS